ncbi:hypothetical protein QTP70_002673 [Hemibagrus guttatus]|uniref:non-specific serine/threonine protein kinase n=1 Tax=Hemibagrus guttatus TaxID=175788 RepID=A0AAE0UTE0_9TELE|nr:hypothetical protein QTP70_002673 [Hemibagrus guttatus]
MRPALFDATRINDEFKRITTINLESTFMAKLDHCTQKLMDVVSSTGGAQRVRIRQLKDMLLEDNEEFEASLERQVMKIAIIEDRSTPAFDHRMATIVVEGTKVQFYRAFLKMVEILNNNFREVRLPDPHAFFADTPSFMPRPDDGDLDDSMGAVFPGPLMSNTMQKDGLMQFIQCQAHECLQHAEKVDNKEAYLFWQMMELFCRHNGKVIMAQVATTLFKSCGLLRKKASKLSEYKTLSDWCLPLAQLLCSSAPDDEHRQAVIKMGDDLASRDMMYAAHICYVAAKVDLGTRSQFDLIGCESLPFGMTVLTAAIERTEVYEYVLSLTSGLAQPNFQMFKLCHASRLVQAEFPDEALQYCEAIARAVITFPNSFKRSFIERLISLFIRLQGCGKVPEWMREVMQLHRVKVADANANAVPEQHSTSTGSEIQDSESAESDRSDGSDSSDESHGSYSVNDELPALQYTDLDSEAVLNSRYTMGELLGKGGFGCVYAATRKEDGKEVAVKFMEKDHFIQPMEIPGVAGKVHAEVALMKIASESPQCSNIIELLEWFEMPDQIILALERPSPCVDLHEFAESQGGCLTEDQTRGVMKQVIRAVWHCCDRRVLHRDVKAQNLLINTDTLEVKLIDFGCGELLLDVPYRDYAGTLAFSPPEWVMFNMYMGIPATIWGLGILFFNLVCGFYPFESETDIEDGHLKFSPNVSRDSCWNQRP